jgi:cyclic pyranopterin phosphate synthase
MPAKTLTHLDSAGRARMVDVAAKPVTQRSATAEGFIRLRQATVAAISDGQNTKGDVLAAARIAGILGAKRTGELIPLCHPLPLEHVSVCFELPPRPRDADAPVDLRIIATAAVTARTGVEMEALTAVSVAALTIYDMCKSVDKTMLIHGIRLLEKTGGQSGTVAHGRFRASAIPRGSTKRRRS